MKLKMLVVDFEFSTRAKRWIVRLAAAGLVVAGSIAAAYASGVATWTSGQLLTSATLNANFAAVQTPPGTIAAYVGTAAPSGWLLCDGTLLNGTDPQYAALYAVIANTFGGTPSAASFNVPDLRGRFLRGWDHGAGNDPDATARSLIATGGSQGDLPGSLEGDSFKAHTHAINDPGHTHAMSVAFTCGTGNWTYGGNNWDCEVTNSQTNIATTSTTGITIQSNGANETRPANVSVNFIIKL
jgi:microcystin-dependent protein